MRVSERAGGAAVDAAARSAVIDALLARLREHYVFPDVAEEMERAIRGRLGAGEYDDIDGADALRERLTAQLQQVSHDKHLRLSHSVEPRPAGEDARPSPEEREERRREAMSRNFGFERVERLAGNIGYLDLRGFAPAEWAVDRAVAAMALLADTEALIVDLRNNGGGSPSMIALLSSYLFDAEPVHLNDLYWRADDSTRQWWTFPYLPGRRYGDKPVYVLTSGRTFSGAEEFTYNLKNLGRATIIGETTGGGAHPGDRFWLDEHFAVFIPTGRAINPITGTNWEGTGVIPDIAVPEQEALKTAYAAALKRVLESAGDTPTGARGALAEEARAAQAELER